MFTMIKLEYFEVSFRYSGGCFDLKIPELEIEHYNLNKNLKFSFEVSI